MASIFRNLINKWSGKGITDAQAEVNAFNANEAQKARDFEEQMSNTAYQRAVADMQAAGLNPALMYGNGAGGASTPGAAAATAGSDPTGGLSFSDLVQTLMSPLSVVQGLQNIEQTKANIDKTIAEADNTRQRTETEKFNTRIAGINAGYADALQGQTLENLRMQYSGAAADMDLKVASKDKILSEKEAQDILNRYLDERQQAEIKQIAGNISKMSAEEAKLKAEKVFQDWTNKFVKDKGFLPSSNDWLMLATTIAGIFGVEGEDIKGFLSDLPEKVKEKNQQVEERMREDAEDATGKSRKNKGGSR